MWEILCHKSAGSSSPSLGDGLFEPSFLEPLHEQKRHNQVTVETEIFHHPTRAVDTYDGGQALPPSSSAVHDRTTSQNSEHEHWSQSNSVPADNSLNQGPLLRDPWMWAGSGFPGDLSFMDVTHDPFFQFQDEENYRGAWKFGNL